MTGNIIGESFEKYVKDQILLRQEIYGSGLTDERTLEQINYLNSRTAWIKMASSVEIIESKERQVAFDNVSSINGVPQFEETETSPQVIGGEKRLADIGLKPDIYLGQKLAKKAILFRTLSEGNFDSQNEFRNYTYGAGYNKNSDLWNTTNAYGLGGNEFGLQPPPGIISFNVKHLNRGSIRKGVVTLKAYNRVQFEIIELLYLRLGYTMLIEWGNHSYYSNKTKEKENITTSLIEKFWFQEGGKSHLEVLQEIEKLRNDYNGNYDGFFGKVSNFNWSFNSDGSYDITIELVSLGDVIESLNVNIYDSNSIYNYSIDPNKNTNIISNFLNDLRGRSQYIKLQEIKSDLRTSSDGKVQNQNQLRSIQTKLKEIKENSDVESEIITNYDGEVVDISQITIKEKFDREGLMGLLSGDKPNTDYRYCIRFGAFINFLNDYIFPRIKNSSKSFPIISIKNAGLSNLMSADKRQFSVDPKICFVRNDSLVNNLNQTPSYEVEIKNIQDLNKYFNPWSFSTSEKKDVLVGDIMNIYLNFSFIENVLKVNQDNKGNVKLYSFLETICNNINKALGGINNLEPVVDEGKNQIAIIDSSFNIPNFLGEEEDNITFNLYGYNNNTSNFVKDFSFQTEISPDLSTIISIGATAAGTVVGEDATAFSNWNQGLKDRFTEKVSDAPEYKPLNIDNIGEKSKQKISNYLDGSISSNALTYREIQDAYAERAVRERKEREEKKLLYETTHFEGYLIEAFGGKTSTFRDPITRAQAKYFEFEDNFIERGYKVVNNLVKEENERKKKEQSLYSSNTGFIPVRLKIRIDGLSGIKIYNKLIIDTKFLPSNYPDALEFVITQVNHELVDNNWVTSLETISLPKTYK